MINDEIAGVLERMASYIELVDTSKNAFFRVRAFKRASEIVYSLPVDLADPKFVNSPQLLVAMEGIGTAIAAHIVEYLKTGKINDYEKLKAECPLKLEELLQIQGLGTKKIKKLYEELGVTDINSLKEAATNDKISKIAGFGPKSQQNILDGLNFAIINKDKKLISQVEEIVSNYITYMKNDANLISFEPLGSFRRKKEVVGDIDFLTLSKANKETVDYFCNYPEIEKILSQGETKASVWLKQKIQVDMRIVDQDSYGSAKQYFTGSKEHNVKVRNIAIDKGFKLSEYGLFNRETNELIEGKSEEEIYRKLGLDYIEPELRENRGEVELALRHKLPKIITIDDIYGDMHTHSNWSDGNNTPEEMILAAIELGYKYYGISDHGGNLQIANALGNHNILDYITQLTKLKEKYASKIKIFIGIEGEVNKDGNYDIADEYLQKLDYVIAGVHLSTKMDSDQMTKRIENAVNHPKTLFLAHPTGRLIGQRPGYEFDYERIFDLCAKKNVAMEINSNPIRLDLSDNLVKAAIEKRVKILINTDAHSTNELSYINYGVNVARRGWVTKNDLYYPVKI